MKTTHEANLCRAFLYAAGPERGRGKRRDGCEGPVVTISREAGARGNSIARALTGVLEASTTIPRRRPWTVFNEGLIDCVIEEHGLPERTLEYFPEDKAGEIHGLIGEMLGLHPGTYTSARMCAETIRRLAVAGNAIVVGRGANLVTAGMKCAVHVRLVGELETRVRHFAKVHNLSVKAAEAEVLRRDRARKRYVKANFDRNIADPSQYDLVINTSRLEDAAVTRLVRNAMEAKCG